jgi:head-tail adaptor
MARTVTRIRRQQDGADRYGNATYVETEAEISGAMFAPERDSTEVITVGRTTLSSKPTLYWLKQHPDITSADRMRVDGVEYDIDGIPSPWFDDLGGTDVGGLVVTLSRVEEAP